MFFNDWFSLVRVIVVGTCAYVALIILLRASGKRTLSKMNAFDFVVTVAIGSTLATVVLSKDVALAEGVTASRYSSDFSSSSLGCPCAHRRLAVG